VAIGANDLDGETMHALREPDPRVQNLSSSQKLAVCWQCMRNSYIANMMRRLTWR